MRIEGLYQYSMEQSQLYVIYDLCMTSTNTYLSYLYSVGWLRRSISQNQYITIILARHQQQMSYFVSPAPSLPTKAPGNVPINRAIFLQ